MPEEQLQPREGEAGEGSENGERMSGRAETGVGCQVGPHQKGTQSREGPKEVFLLPSA